MKIAYALIVILISTVLSAAQTTNSLERILDGARKQSIIYRETFTDLIGDELKSFERTNQRGEVKKRTTIKSQLLVYRTDGAKAGSAELRIVEEIDGKPVSDAKRRSEKLLEELARPSARLSVLDRLQLESTRYDPSLKIFGATLFQATVLSEQLRSAMRFEEPQTAVINERNVFVVRYLQTTPSPYIAFNTKLSSSAFVTIEIELPDGANASDLRLRGTLWIDQETLQIWREERDVILKDDPSFSFLSSRHDYALSDFGVLLPTSIQFIIKDVKRKKGLIVVTSGVSAKFDYTNFRKTNVEVKISDDEEPEKSTP
jgi:hypothetical protein